MHTQMYATRPCLFRLVTLHRQAYARTAYSHVSTLRVSRCCSLFSPLSSSVSSSPSSPSSPSSSCDGDRMHASTGFRGTHKSTHHHVNMQRHETQTRRHFQSKAYTNTSPGQTHAHTHGQSETQARDGEVDEKGGEGMQEEKEMEDDEVIELAFPQLHDDMQGGKISKWLKNVGDYVQEDEALVEIETEVAFITYNSEEDGYLAEKCYDEGDELIPVNQIFAILVSDAEEVEDGRFKEISSYKEHMHWKIDPQAK